MSSILEQFSQKDPDAVTVKRSNIDRSKETEIEQPNLNPEETPPEKPAGENPPNKNGGDPSKPAGEISNKPNLPNTGYNPNQPNNPEGGTQITRDEIITNNQAAGEMILEAYDTVKPMLIAAYVDGDPDDYTMSKFKKMKMKKIFDLYFKTLEKPISPKAVFFSTVSVMLAADVLEAKAEKKKKDKEKRGESQPAKKSVATEKRETPKPPVKKARPKPEPEPEPEYYDDDEPEEKEEHPMEHLTKRTRFDIDKNGFYCYPEGTYNFVTKNRLKQSQRIEKADDEIIEMWRSGMRNKAIRIELGLE